MWIFRYGKEKMVEKAQFTIVYHYVAPHFETTFNAAMVEKMLRAKFSVY